MYEFVKNIFDALSKLWDNYPLHCIIVLSLISSASGVITTHYARLHKKRRTRLLELAIYENLNGIRAGVWVREPNNSAHVIQNLLHQALVKRGVALFDLRFQHAENLIRDGEWSPEISTSPLDAMIVGRILIKPRQTFAFKKISVRGIHTATGKHFHELPVSDENYRAPNAYQANPTDRDTINFNEGDVSRFNVYVEPSNVFSLRCANEQVQVPTDNIDVTLDVTFYGPQGQIHGAYARTKVFTGKTVVHPTELLDLVDGVVAELADTIKSSLYYHSVSRAEMELDARPRRLPPVYGKFNSMRARDSSHFLCTHYLDQQSNTIWWAKRPSALRCSFLRKVMFWHLNGLSRSLRSSFESFHQTKETHEGSLLFGGR